MISARIKNIDLIFETAPGLFSPNSIDAGTLAMLSVAEFLPDDKVLDLGCGYGVVGILAGKLTDENNVTMCDISEQAVEHAKINARLNSVPGIRILLSDGYENIEDGDFTLILSNPPYHANFSVPKRFIETGFRKLAVGGRLVMVTKRLDWYKNKLAAVFGGVRVHETDGYYVFVAEKRGQGKRKKPKPSGNPSKKLRRRQQRRNGGVNPPSPAP